MLLLIWQQRRMHKFFDFALDPVIKEAEGLYYRKEKNMVSFCTYFNSVPVGKLKNYSSAEDIIFRVRVENETVLKIKCTGSDDIIASCVTDSYSELRVCISEVPDGSELMYLTAEGGNIVSVSVYLSGSCRDINPVLITCTYRREEQLKKNINYLLGKFAGEEFDIIISDNDSAIDGSCFASGRVTVIHNDNNGGSGGYHCGMKEAVSRNRYTHFILMDDDVTAEYCAFQKVTGFIRFLRDEYSELSVSGAMISSSEPCIQFESGGFFSDDGVQSSCGYHLDLSVEENIIADEREKKINYAAWWLVCMPACYAEKGEYPAPFFIKYDDVEYSLRCSMRIVSLCGFGVWHEDFGTKYSPSSDYYNTRNYLHLMKRHTDNFNSFRAFRKGLWLLTEKICRQQYNGAEAVIRGYCDYLKGDNFLKAADNKAILEELKKLQVEMLNDTELMEKYGVAFDNELYCHTGKKKFRRYMQPLLYGQLIPHILCCKLTVTDVISDRKEQYFGAAKVLHYCPQTGRGYVTDKSLLKSMCLLLKFIYIHIKYTGGRK